MYWVLVYITILNECWILKCFFFICLIPFPCSFLHCWVQFMRDLTVIFFSCNVTIPIYIYFFWVTPCCLQDLSSPARDWNQAMAVKTLSPNPWITGEFPCPIFILRLCWPYTTDKNLFSPFLFSERFYEKVVVVVVQLMSHIWLLVGGKIMVISSNAWKNIWRQQFLNFRFSFFNTRRTIWFSLSSCVNLIDFFFLENYLIRNFTLIDM